MAGEDQVTEKLILRAPAEFKYGENKDQTAWNVTTKDGKQKFVIFDTKIGEAIIAKLVDVEQEYVHVPPKPGKKDRMIIGVPGVVDKKKGGGGGRGGYSSGPMFTDRQVALTAAVQACTAGGAVPSPHDVIKYFEVFAQALTSTPPAPEKPTAAKAKQEPKPAAKTAAKPKEPDRDKDPASVEQLGEIETLAQSTDYDLDKFLADKAIWQVEDLTVAQADHLITFLRKRAAPAAAS